MSDKAVYEPLSGVPLPPVSRKRREPNNQDNPNYDTEPTPDYQDETAVGCVNHVNNQ